MRFFTVYWQLVCIFIVNFIERSFAHCQRHYLLNIDRPVFSRFATGLSYFEACWMVIFHWQLCHRIYIMCKILVLETKKAGYFGHILRQFKIRNTVYSMARFFGKHQKLKEAMAIFIGQHLCREWLLKLNGTCPHPTVIWCSHLGWSVWISIWTLTHQKLV